MGIARKGTWMLASALLLGSALTAVAAPDSGSWKGRHGLGGYINFAHFAVRDQDVSLTTEGLSYVYGLSRKLRIGGNLGVYVSHRGGDTGGTVLGFSIAPTAAYDLITKTGGSLYVVTHPVAFDLVHGSGNTANLWNLNILNLGLGIEALASRDVGVALEGDVLGFGLSHAADQSEMTVTAVAFPAVRLSVRMYF